MRISDWSSDVCSSDLLFQQVRRDPFGKRRRQTDIHLAADMRLAKQDALLDLFGQVQDPLRLLEQHQAVLGGDRAARVAGEQRRLEFVLEQSDLAAEGGLRDVQSAGGLLETFVPRYRHEVAELTQFHSLTSDRKSTRLNSSH